MQRVAFLPIAIVGLSVYLYVCMSRWWIERKRFEINPQFFTFLYATEENIQERMRRRCSS